MEQVKERLQVLLKPLWSNQDIRTYLGCGNNKASLIRQQAVLNNGKCLVNLKKVKRDAVLDLVGTTYENELQAMQMKEVNENEN